MYDSVITEKQIVNGIDVDGYHATIEEVQTEPEIAKFQFRASSSWINGGHNQTCISGLYGAGREIERNKTFVIEMDEPEILLGTDIAANPVEYTLAALAGCLTTTLVYHAAAQGVTIESIESSFEGDTDLRGFLGLDESVRNGFSQIRVSFKVKADASEEKIAELVDLAQRRSGVFDMLSRGIPISVELAS